MRYLLLGIAFFAAAFGGALVGHGLGADTSVSPTTGDATLRADVDGMRQQIADLTRRLETAELAPAVVSPQRSDAAPVPVPAPGDEPTRRDPHWYLDQYVLSFAVDAQGSEYFRLAVAAYVVELASPIAAIVRDPNRPALLRLALVAMLGKRRFDDSPDVLGALLAAVRPPSTEALALRALEALDLTGSTTILPELEAVVPTLREEAVRVRALSLVVELAGAAANEALARLFARAPDDAMRVLILQQLETSDGRAALDVLRDASGGAQPTRLAAARRVHDFDDPDFDTFAANWRTVETDPDVLAVLGNQVASGNVPGWSPRQATGPPNADRTRDDPAAWAPREPDMGLQWLQLTYATPMQAHGVRICEVNAPGAVAEVLARGDDGPWVSMWRGTASGGNEPLVISFPRTAFAVRAIRLVLDTDRTPGWNEIDAVELLGPSGSQWASRASASSTYASTQTTRAPVPQEFWGERTRKVR